MSDERAELPSDSRIGRVALRVRDLDRVARFYESVVGLSVIGRDTDRAVLGAGGTPLLVLLADADAPERGDDEAGLFHLAIRVPTRAALGAALRRLETEWRLTGASDHHVSEALYTRDPEGNGVEVYADRPRSTWPETADGRVEMDTLPLDREELRAAARESDSLQEDPAPPATDIGHVHLETADVDRATEFYRDAVGLRLRQRLGGEAAFLAAGDYHHHLGVNAWGERSASAADSLGLAWYEFVVSDTAALDALRDRLETADVTGREAGDALVVTDPDGLEVRFRVGE